MIGSIDVSLRAFLRRTSLAAMLIPVAGFLLHVWSPLEAAVVALGIVASWSALQREYLRSVLLVYARPDSMLRADLLSIVVLLSGVSIAVYTAKPAVLWAIAALVASALAGEAAARRSINANPGFAAGDAQPFWREMRPLGTWATIGALTYWVYNQSYNYVLAMRIDLSAVADVNATRLLLMPTIVLTVGIKSLLVPTASGWLAESSIRRLIERLLVFATGIALIDLGYCAFLWLTRDWLTHDLMHKTIANRDLLLVLWAVLSLIALYRDLLQTGLFALRKFKSLAGVTAVSAVVSLSIMWLCIKSWGPAAALIGQVAGEAVNLAGVVLLLGMAHHEDRRA
jgi:O-antigen/teichoic acid export membrane protein